MPRPCLLKTTWVSAKCLKCFWNNTPWRNTWQRLHFACLCRSGIAAGDARPHIGSLLLFVMLRYSRWVIRKTFIHLAPCEASENVSFYLHFVNTLISGTVWVVHEGINIHSYILFWTQLIHFVLFTFTAQHKYYAFQPSSVKYIQ